MLGCPAIPNHDDSTSNPGAKRHPAADGDTNAATTHRDGDGYPSTTNSYQHFDTAYLSDHCFRRQLLG